MDDLVIPAERVMSGAGAALETKSAECLAATLRHYREVLNRPGLSEADAHVVRMAREAVVAEIQERAEDENGRVADLMAPGYEEAVRDVAEALRTNAGLQAALDAMVAKAPCPRCASTGTLTVTDRLVAKPVGTFSLAGHQPKVSARRRPELACSECGLRRLGEYDPDGRHVTFPPGPTSDQDADQ